MNFFCKKAAFLLALLSEILAAEAQVIHAEDATGKISCSRESGLVMKDRNYLQQKTADIFNNLNYHKLKESMQ